MTASVVKVASTLHSGASPFFDSCFLACWQVDGGSNVPDDILDMIDDVINESPELAEFAIESVLLSERSEWLPERSDRECVRFETFDGLHGILYGYT